MKLARAVRRTLLGVALGLSLRILLGEDLHAEDVVDLLRGLLVEVLTTAVLLSVDDGDERAGRGGVEPR